jgi:hypothetical protein
MSQYIAHTAANAWGEGTVGECVEAVNFDGRVGVFAFAADATVACSVEPRDGLATPPDKEGARSTAPGRKGVILLGLVRRPVLTTGFVLFEGLVT